MEDRLAVGVDVGGTKTTAVLLSESRGMLANITEPTDRTASPSSLASHVQGLIGQLIHNSAPHEALTALGVGLPGLITPNRIFRNSIILPTWQDVNFGLIMYERLRIPVIVDNDTTMAALGHWGTIPQGQQPSCMVCLTLGTGVGSAILLNGVPFRGPDGTAGQIGHLTVDSSGRACDCGNLGCLNAYASGTAIRARYIDLRAQSGQSLPGGEVTGATIQAALTSGDPSASTAVTEAANALGVSISSIVNVLNPDLVVLGGGVANLGRYLIDPIRAAIQNRSFPAPGERVVVRQAAHGVLAGALGAASVAMVP